MPQDEPGHRGLVADGKVGELIPIVRLDAASNEAGQHQAGMEGWIDCNIDCHAGAWR